MRSWELWLCAAAVCVLLPIRAAALSAVPVIDGPAADAPGNADFLGLRQMASASGLPQMTVFALAQDIEGYVYAGTQDGLARWDGRQFNRVTLGTAQNDWVTHLWADAACLWIGTDTSGLYCHGAAGTHEVLDDAARRLPAIEAISGDTRGGAWIGTAHGLYHCAAHRCVAQPGTETLEVAELLATENGQLWVGTNLDGLYQFHWDGNKGLQRSDVHLTRKQGLPNDAVRALASDRQGRLWIGTGRGLARWDGKSLMRWTTTGRGPLGGVFDLGLMPDGSMLAALWGGGLGQFRMDDGYRIFDLADGLPDSYLQSLLISTDGVQAIVWLGSSAGGVLRLESGRWRSFDERHGLPQRVVVGVGKIRIDPHTDSIWVGTLGGAVIRQAGRWQPLLPPPYQQRVVYDVVSDTHTRWFATSRGVLIDTDGEWREIDGERGGLQGASAEHLLQVGDSIWVGTAHGLSAIVNGEVQHLFADAEPYATMAVRSLAKLEMPGLGPRILIGSGAGPLLSDGVNISALGGDCAKHGTIYDIEVLDGSELWLGTRSGALRLNFVNGAAQCRLLQEPGAPSKTVYEIERDQQGRVYLFGYDGVRRIDPTDSSSYRRFGLDDGLPALEFNRDAYLDDDGRIWAANADGLVLFDPADTGTAPRQAPLLLRAEYDNRSLPAGARLSAQHGELAFSPRLLSYFQEHRIRYRTQLIGLDQTASAWLSDGDRRYPRIPPGEYRFRVEAMDAADRVHGPVEYAFRVAAPWWQHPFSVLAAALALLGIGMAAGRVRARALAMRAARLEALVAERTRALALASNTDALTGSWNRRYFYACIRTWLTDSEAQGGLLLLLVDIDFFKQINDNHGHSGGDLVLIEVAKRLRQAPGSELIRWGGEEFLLILTGGVDAAAARVDSVLRSVSAHAVAINGSSLEVRCSIGYTRCCPPDGLDIPIDVAISRADAALYQAKRAGRNRAVAADA